MADNAVIGLDIVARLDQFRSEMAKIPDIGSKEAKALAAQLSKDIKAAETAAKKAADAAKTVKPAMDQAAQAADRFGDSAGKLGSNAGKLAGILDTLVPGAGSLARTVADVADAGEVAATASKGFGLSLGSILTVAGPVVLAIGALALAYQHYKAELDEAERKQEQSLHISEDVQALTEQVTKAKRDLAKAVGGETAIEAENAEITEKWTKAAQASNKTLKEKQAELEKELKTHKDLGSFRLEEVQTIKDLTGALEQNAAEQKRNNDLASLGAQTEKDAREATRLKAEADALAAKHLADKAAAASKAAEKQAKDAEAMRKATAAALAYNDALAGIDEIGKDAERSQMDAYERLYDGAQQQLDKIEAAKKEAAKQAAAAGGDYALAEAAAEKKAVVAREAVWDAYYTDLDELRKADDAKADKASEEKNDKEREAMEQLYTEGAQLASDAVSSIQQAYADAYANISDNVTSLLEWQAASEEYLTDSQREQLNERIKKQKQAAREAFEAQKIAAMATAAINTALAVSQALGSAPWPYNLIPAGFALAAGLAEEAAIASTQPAFHGGGPMDMAPDELSVTARGGEWMLNPVGRRMYGDEELKRANAGQSPGSRDVVAVSVYKHTRQVDRWKSDGLAAGDPIYKAIQEGKLVGHRTNR